MHKKSSREFQVGFNNDFYAWQVLGILSNSFSNVSVDISFK